MAGGPRDPAGPADAKVCGSGPARHGGTGGEGGGTAIWEKTARGRALGRFPCAGGAGRERATGEADRDAS